jgi:hypothetical protein
VLGIYLSERLNRWGSKHWQQFAGRDYFDEHGSFITVVYATPLLLITCIILVRNCVFDLIANKQEDF